MSAVGNQKTFVITHVFNDVESMEPEKMYYGPEEEHFGVTWRICMNSDTISHRCYLECLKPRRSTQWDIDLGITSKILKSNGNWRTFSRCYEFSHDSDLNASFFADSFQSSRYVIRGKVTVRLEVELMKISGIDIPKLRKFDDDVAKEFSDVVLSAGDQQFHVCKMYLSLHSTYFKSLFSGNFAESEKSIIELKDIHPQDLQYFLEVLYGESVIDEGNVEGILKLADMYDARTAVRRCEEFLLEKSKNSMKVKFTCAVRYKLNALKKKCISELKTTAEVRELIPENAGDYDPSDWKKLCLKACSSE